MDEAQCYVRCYGARSGLVQIVSTPDIAAERPAFWYWPRPVNGRVSGEELRRQFAERLERRAEAA